MDCQEYHDKIWLPFSHSIDKKLHKRKHLKKVKKIFDIHFSVLGLLGIIATPEDDVDCYIYIFKRAKPHKYEHLTWQQRKRMIKALLKEIGRTE